MNEQEKAGAGNAASASPGLRKPYEKPVLEIYGALAEITQATMLSGTPDGAAHPNKHFTS